MATTSRTTSGATTSKSRTTTSGRKTTAAKPKTSASSPVKPAGGARTVRTTAAGTAKPVAAKSRAAPAKPAAPKPATPEPRLVTSQTPVVAAPDLRKKELIDKVVARSGIKKKDAKPVIEAMLAVLGETVAGGREFNLQPLGKLRVNRSTDKGTGRVIVCKLRQSTQAPATPPKDPLAEAAE